MNDSDNDFLLKAQNGSKLNDSWFQDYLDQDDDFQIDEYDLTATPNDFNVLTIYNFIESGAVKIPGFQRNYVWDIKRASKLIESLILGLPVPQVFLYEESKNSFLLIDGQQRLMSIYYFMKQRFPKKEKRSEIRRVFGEGEGIPKEVLYDDKYFDPFKLVLPERLPSKLNKFKGLNYETLGDYKTQFDLRPVRNVIVKQNAPAEDDSSVFEIFNRLNTGGVNLRPQEIRASLYHSEFYDMLYRINNIPDWRRFLSSREPDLHMKDVEILLRGFAMLVDGRNYAPSMTKFLNQFSRKSKTNKPEQNQYLFSLFESFVTSISNLPEKIFFGRFGKQFNIALFEGVFTSVCEEAFHKRNNDVVFLTNERISQLSADEDFVQASQKSAAETANVKTRLRRAKAIIAG